MPHLFSSKNLAFIIGLLFFLVFSCKKEEYLTISDRKGLFSAPSEEELDLVFNEWKNRDLTPADYTVIQEEELLDGKFKFKIVSFKVSGIKEYGALLIPQSVTPLPVRMFVGGFGLKHTVNSVNLAFDSASGSSFIFAIPALRGQSLEITLNGVTYSSPLSEGVLCDAFDGATDDVLAFLTLIQQTEISADVNRTSVRGGSRGGTVALLAGIRDERIKRVVGIACPLNLMESTSRNEQDDTYQCQFLNDYKNGQATIDQARKKMIASSPFYFAEHLPLTQLHLGLGDMIVPFYQGYALEQRIHDLGKESTFQLYTYDRTHVDIGLNNTTLLERIERFLSAL